MAEQIIEHDVVVVGGFGSGLKNSILYPLFTKIGDETGLHVDVVEGLEETDGHKVMTVSAQTDHLYEMVQARDNPMVLIGHCAGGVSVVNCLEKLALHDEQTVHGILLSPPFVNPIETVRHEKVVQNISISEGHYRLRIKLFDAEAPYDFDRAAVRHALIPDNFYDDLADFSGDFVERVHSLAEKGVVSLVVPAQDWNEQSLLVAAEWPFDMLQLPDAAHALNVPGGTIEAQQRNCEKVLEYAAQKIMRRTVARV